MDIEKAKPIGTSCIACHGQANVLMAGWTIDGEPEVQHWTCPRCSTSNTIMVQGTVVGVAFVIGRIVSGKPWTVPARANGAPRRSGAGQWGPASDGDGGSGGAKPPGHE